MQEERGHKTNETTKKKLKNNIYGFSDWATEGLSTL
jgi:hypothetical protein